MALISAFPYLIFDLDGYVPNHKHIYAYVLVSICLLFFFFKEDEILSKLRDQAKYIIGLCFLFAVIGKFLAPEFLNGGFFEFTNTTDPRFFGFTSYVAGVNPTLLLENAANIDHLLNTNNTTFSFKLNGVENLKTIGLIISYWTIFIEGMIAISFCLPSKFSLSKYRNVFLIAFIITTYPIATVYGFAIILAALGYIQSTKENQITKASIFYMLVFIALPLIAIPFVRILGYFV
ncbi:hypothetical protein [Pseudotamlana haliotis]|nr:hypothetical protein [Tamlana haliotis]